MNQNKGPLWTGLHTLSSLPGLVLMYLPSGTRALLKTDPNPSQVIEVTLVIWEHFGVDSVPFVSLLCSVTLKFAYSVIILARKS